MEYLYYYEQDDSDDEVPSFPYTWLGNFEALENFHKALLRADHPLDMIALDDDDQWTVAISLFGRRWCPYRQQWVEDEDNEVEEEEEGRITGDPATRHNKQELARCFNLLLEIVNHFQYGSIHVRFHFNDDVMHFDADAMGDEEKEEPPEEQSTKKAAISEVRVLFDCGPHRSTDTDLPFWKLLELSQRMSRKIDLPWQFFVDPGQIQISEETKFQAKHLQLELHNQQTLTALTKVLEKERLPNLESIEMVLKRAEQRNLGCLLQQLGTFSLLSKLKIGRFLQYGVNDVTTFSMSDAKALSSLRLRKLALIDIDLASETATKAFVDGLVETGALISSIEFSGCILPEEGVLYLLKKAAKLRNLEELRIVISPKDREPMGTKFEALRSAYRLCNKESTSLQSLLVYWHTRTTFLSIGPGKDTEDTYKEAKHYWKLNKAGRRAIQDLPSISPPGLVIALLDKAQEAYQENGIYHMLREHADLRTIVAECNGSDGKQRHSNKKRKIDS